MRLSRRLWRFTVSLILALFLPWAVLARGTDSAPLITVALNGTVARPSVTASFCFRERPTRDIPLIVAVQEFPVASPLPPPPTLEEYTHSLTAKASRWHGSTSIVGAVEIVNAPDGMFRGGDLASIVWVRVDTAALCGGKEEACEESPFASSTGGFRSPSFSIPETDAPVINAKPEKVTLDVVDYLRGLTKGGHNPAGSRTVTLEWGSTGLPLIPMAVIPVSSCAVMSFSPPVLTFSSRLGPRQNTTISFSPDVVRYLRNADRRSSPPPMLQSGDGLMARVLNKLTRVATALRVATVPSAIQSFFAEWRSPSRLVSSAPGERLYRAPSPSNYSVPPEDRKEVSDEIADELSEFCEDGAFSCHALLALLGQCQVWLAFSEETRLLFPDTPLPSMSLDVEVVAGSISADPQPLLAEPEVDLIGVRQPLTDPHRFVHGLMLTNASSEVSLVLHVASMHVPFTDFAMPRALEAEIAEDPGHVRDERTSAFRHTYNLTVWQESVARSMAVGVECVRNAAAALGAGSDDLETYVSQCSSLRTDSVDALPPKFDEFFYFSSNTNAGMQKLTRRPLEHREDFSPFGDSTAITTSMRRRAVVVAPSETVLLRLRLKRALNIESIRWEISPPPPLSAMPRFASLDLSEDVAVIHGATSLRLQIPAFTLSPSTVYTVRAVLRVNTPRSWRSEYYSVGQRGRTFTRTAEYEVRVLPGVAPGVLSADLHGDFSAGSVALHDTQVLLTAQHFCFEPSVPCGGGVRSVEEADGVLASTLRTLPKAPETRALLYAFWSSTAVDGPRRPLGPPTLRPVFLVDLRPGDHIIGVTVCDLALISCSEAVLPSRVVVGSATVRAALSVARAAGIGPHRGGVPAGSPAEKVAILSWLRRGTPVSRLKHFLALTQTAARHCVTSLYRLVLLFLLESVAAVPVMVFIAFCRRGARRLLHTARVTTARRARFMMTQNADMRLWIAASSRHRGVPVPVTSETEFESTLEMLSQRTGLPPHEPTLVGLSKALLEGRSRTHVQRSKRAQPQRHPLFPLPLQFDLTARFYSALTRLDSIAHDRSTGGSVSAVLFRGLLGPGGATDSESSSSESSVDRTPPRLIVVGILLLFVPHVALGITVSGVFALLLASPTAFSRLVLSMTDGGSVSGTALTTAVAAITSMLGSVLLSCTGGRQAARVTFVMIGLGAILLSTDADGFSTHWLRSAAVCSLLSCLVRGVITMGLVVSGHGHAFRAHFVDDAE